MFPYSCSCHFIVNKLFLRSTASVKIFFCFSRHKWIIICNWLVSASTLSSLRRPMPPNSNYAASFCAPVILFNIHVFGCHFVVNIKWNKGLPCSGNDILNSRPALIGPVPARFGVFSTTGRGSSAGWHCFPFTVSTEALTLAGLLIDLLRAQNSRLSHFSWSANLPFCHEI